MADPTQEYAPGPERRPGSELPVRVVAGIRHILVCVDRSAHAEVCLAHAVSLARPFLAKITLLHVMEPAPSQTRPSGTDALSWEIARHEAEAYLRRMQRQAEDQRAEGRTGPSLSSPRIERRVVQGHPAERIHAVGQELDVDLTVLASHGVSGVRQWELGSTVQQVLALTSRSVFIARASVERPAQPGPRRILVPLDGSTRTECVLPTIARLAASYGAEVVLAHVAPEPVQTAILSSKEDLNAAHALARRVEIAAGRYLDRLRVRLSRDVARVRARVVRARDERDALLDLTAREEADLVVVSAHGAVCNPGRRFGSVSTHMLEHGRTALLVLQDLSRSELDRAAQLGEEARTAPIRSPFHGGSGEGN